MKFRSLPPPERPVPLKPFLLKIRDGYLLGLAMEPGKGSPCVQCVESWLQEREVWTERADLSDLKVRRDLIGDLISENTPHSFFEIADDGNVTRLDCVVFPHPNCYCARENYVAPRELSKKTNFAFSPLVQIKCARFGTPSGNLWLSSATGNSPVGQSTITAYGVGHEREESRFRAVDEWMKRAAMNDLPPRIRDGARVASEVFQTGQPVVVSKLSHTSYSESDIVGIGNDRNEAILDALFSLAKARTLKKYAAEMKNPMLVVGANNWIRNKVPFFLLQQYDLHVLFYPNSTQAWVVGIAAFSRVRVDEKPIFVFGAHAEINKAMDNAIFRILEACRPDEWRPIPLVSEPEDSKKSNISKLNLWWTHWIYRCPKISLKDVLHLENYKPDLEVWRDYFRDGQEPLFLAGLNNELLPDGFRTVIKLSVSGELPKRTHNAIGIGIWSDFRDALA